MMTASKQAVKPFFGWYVLTGVTVSSMIGGGIFMAAFGVFLPNICKDFGWSRGEVAGFFSVAALIIGLASPLWGLLVAKFGPRANILVGCFLSALGLVSVYFVNGLWQFYLLYIVIGVGGGGLGGYLATCVVVNNWFVKKRSLAMGILGTGPGLAGILFPPLVTALIVSFGWRLSYVALGALMIVFVVIISGVFLIRNRPEDMKQFPDGEYTGPVAVAAKIERKQTESSRGRRWQWIKQFPKGRAVWLIAVFASASSFLQGFVNSHQIALLQDSGFSPMAAATTMSILAVSLIGGSLFFGILALKINMKRVVLANFVIQLLSIVILLTTKNVAFLYVYSILAGFSIGAIYSAAPTVLSAYYQKEYYVRSLSILALLQTSFLAAGAFVGGVIYDATSSYKLDFFVLAAFCIVGIVSVAAIPAQRKRELEAAD